MKGRLQTRSIRLSPSSTWIRSSLLQSYFSPLQNMLKRVSLQRVPLENIHFCPCSSNWNRSSLHQCFQDPTESENLANKHPELVKDLLAEAEVVLKDAPMQVGCAVVEGGSRDISIYMHRFVATWLMQTVRWVPIRRPGEAGGLFFAHLGQTIQG